MKSSIDERTMVETEPNVESDSGSTREKSANYDDLHPWQSIVSSSVGGVITSLLTTPFDVVKIRLQAQAKPLAHGDCYIYSSGLTDHLCVHCGAKKVPLCRPGAKLNIPYNGSWVRYHNLRTMCFHSGSSCISSVPHGLLDPPNLPITSRLHGNSGPCKVIAPGGSHRILYKGSVDVAVQVVRNEGVFALWSGLSPTLFMALPGTVIYYSLYDQIKEKLGFDHFATGAKATSQAWIPPITGALSRTAAVMILSPLELARTKVQSEAMSYSYLFKAMRESISARGFRSLWLGAGPTLLRDVPFSALYWFTFDSLKGQILCWKLANSRTEDMVDGQPRLKFSESFLMGAVAGGVAALVTLPFDVIKTHRQIEIGESIFSNRKKAAPNTWSSIRELYRSHGHRVLYTGLVPRLVKVIPACAIMISSFEYMKTYFKKYNLK